MLKGAGHFLFVSVFIPLLLSCADLPDAYNAFLLLLSFVINRLRADSFTDEDIRDLHFRVLELKCLFEGLFPVNESVLNFHFITHLPQFIKKYGPIHGWHELPGERAHSLIKKNLPVGGQNRDLTLIKKYNLIQGNRMRYAFNSKKKSLDNRTKKRIVKSIHSTIEMKVGETFEVTMSNNSITHI